MNRMLLLFLPAVLGAQEPAVVTPPATVHTAPSDALVLFNGRDLSGWLGPDGKMARCEAANGEMVCTSGTGDVRTEQTHGSAQIHLEFLIPHMPDQKGQMRGNSGVYLQGRYELQILDSFENPTYAPGSLGGLYGQAAPLVNAARPPGQWQTYDIFFRAPECDGAGNVTKRAVVTVLLNGILVHDHVAIEKSSSCESGPLLLQDHSGFPGAPRTTMKFRNLWLRPL